jgi:hypothetical protein
VPGWVVGGWSRRGLGAGERPGPTHWEHGAGTGQHQVGPSQRPRDRESLIPSHPPLGRTRPCWGGGAAGPLHPDPAPLAAPPRRAAPRSRPPAPLSPPRPGGPGPRTHPSPTTTHLMACMGAGPGGGGRGREPSCGEMPGAAAAADPSAERAAGDSRAPPSAGREDSRARGGRGGAGASCGGGGAAAAQSVLRSPRLQWRGPRHTPKGKGRHAQASDSADLDSQGGCARR